MKNKICRIVVYNLKKYYLCTPKVRVIISFEEMEEWIEKIERLLPLVQQYVLSLEERNRALILQVETLQGQLQELMQQSQEQQQKYQALKVAQALLGSDETKTEAKLKISRLIREIEQCIVQLSQDK